MQSPAPKIRNGAFYYDLLVSDTTSHLVTATVNDKEKLVFHNSVFSIGLVTNSWKYGCELQFVAFSREAPKLEKRVDKEHSYFRLECGYLPGTHETAEKLRECADQIDVIIGFSEPVVSYSPRRLINEKSNLAEILM
jgi:hypothetical protein